MQANYCVGGTTTLVSHIIDRNAENLTYQWLLEGDTIHGANEETYVTPNDLRAGTYTYTVLVYQTTSDCIGSADVVINVHNDPAITDITVNNTVVCDGGAVVVTANANLEDVLGEATYTWFKNGERMNGYTSKSLVTRTFAKLILSSVSPMLTLPLSMLDASTTLGMNPVS